MFSSLRVSSPLYIFHKDNSPLLEVGIVQSINGPRPKYTMHTPNQEMVLDVQVKVNDQMYTFLALPASQEITDTYSNGESITISDNKNAINQDILAYQLKSKDILASIDTHIYKRIGMRNGVCKNFRARKRAFSCAYSRSTRRVTIF